MIEKSGKTSLHDSRAPFDGIRWNGVYGRSWKKFAADLWQEINEDRVFDGAATLAFYLTFSLFPALIFLLSLLPYLPIPHLEFTVMQTLFEVLPGDTATMVQDTVEGVVAKKHQGLLSLGAILTLWAASSGAYSLMQQLNFTYDVPENRSYLRMRATAALLVVGFGALFLVSLALVMLGDSIEGSLAKLRWWTPVLTVAYELMRWAFTLGTLALGFSLTYYFGPDVKQEFRFLTPGSMLGVLLFAGSSLLFKTYVAHFGNYNATYGGIGTMVVLMLWLNILGLVVLLGSEVNALLEHYAPVGKRKGEKAPGTDAAA